MSGTYTGPRNPDPSDGESVIVIYNYVPSLALPIVAFICFVGIALAAGVHFSFHRKTRLIESIIFLGCLLELVGYAARAVSHFRPFIVIAFIIQYFFIVIAPLAFMSAMYLSSSRIISHFELTLPRWLSRRGLVTFFILSDTVTIICQIAGAALIGVAESRLNDTPPSPSPLSPQQANDILLAGLAAQVASFLFFNAILLMLLRRSAGKARQALVLVLWTSVLLWLRTAFRLGETAEGIFGYASSHESLFGALEFAPIVLGLLPWAVIPLAKFLARPPSFAEKDEHY